MYVCPKIYIRRALSENVTVTQRSQQTWIQDSLLQDQDQDQDLLIQDQDQDQDSEVQDQDQDQDSAVSRPRPRPRLWCPRPRPRLKTYKSNTGSPWLGWNVTNKKNEKSWQAENPAYW